MDTIIKKSLDEYAKKYGGKLEVGETFIAKLNNCAICFDKIKDPIGSTTLTIRVIQSTVDIDDSCELFEPEKE